MSPPAKQTPKSIAHIGRLKNADPSSILQRYFSDESTNDIAASYGVTRQALSYFLLKHAEEDWRAAQVSRAIARKEKAEDDLKDARDPVCLARAREELRGAQWELERLYSRVFGQRSHVTVEQVGDLGERLRRARERVIEPDSVVDAQQIDSQRVSENEESKG